MRFVVALALAIIAGPSFAQTAATVPSPSRVYDLAPWWMDKPIIASVGYVWSEVQANRAAVSATYQVVDKDSAAATKAAADKVRALGQALEAYGPDKVRIATTFSITPLYAQYRDKQGELNDNERADKVERYQVSANVSVDIRDVRLAERIYATMMSAKPSSTSDMSFRLEPENETRTEMARLAVDDARKRALQAAEVAGARLGGVRIIDPTARACETDVLVIGSGRTYAGVQANQVASQARAPAGFSSVEELVVTSARRKAQEVGLNPDDIRMPLQPPLQRLEQKACVVFALN
jgi:uncharacterized protein YggE